MANEKPIITHLKKIKEKLQSQEMSVMVGAGFSKNVSNELYPSWWQLLADMVTEMHGKKYIDDYNKIIPKKNRPELKKFLEDKINDYINETGALRVASKYMELKGYREVVDAYIELRTPYVEIREGIRYLKYFEKDIQREQVLTDDDLAAHTKLVNLPWNNIYTTNYDNLLEKCIDENVEEQIKSQIKDLEHLVGNLEEQINQARQKLEDVENRLNRDSANSGPDRKPTQGADIAQEADTLALPNEEVAEKEDKSQEPAQEIWQTPMWEREHLLHEIETNEGQVKIKEQEISKLEMLLKECPSVVTKSSELALKRTRNIIKLHGSRRTEQDSVYGFDEDARKQYVLTQEDFDQYPVKHEAFTQLMRISLLQESFCLVGFSGVDPNFLAWIGWVRDILFKDSGKRKLNGDKKIYLISASTEEYDYGRSIFHENQRIANIPLLETDSIDFLENQTGKKMLDRKSKKEALKLFFDYLQMDTISSSPSLALEVSHRAKYNQISVDLPFVIIDEHKVDFDGIIERLRPLHELQKYNRIPSMISVYDSRRQGFLSLANFFINKIKAEGDQLKIYLTSVLEFTRAQFFPHSAIFAGEPETFKTLLKYSKETSLDLYGGFMLLDLQDAMWQDDEGRFNKISKAIKKINSKNFEHQRVYLTAVYLLLRLKFGELKTVLSEWSAEGHWVTMKAGLLSHIDLEQAASLLTGAEQEIMQEKLYQLELQDYLAASKTAFNLGKVSEEFKLIKSSGLKPFSEIVEYLILEIRDKESKIIPYGEGKRSISTVIGNASEKLYLQSLQIVGLMLESGYPFATYGRNFRNPQKVYRAISTVLLFFPLASIQSALQFADEKFVKRVAQDFVFNENDLPTLEKICAYLQDAYREKNTPGHIRENIIIFLTELLNVVDPQKWKSFMMIIWSERLNSAGDNSVMKKWDEYLYKALGLLNDYEAIAGIINDCFLMEVEGVISNHSIQCLYVLANAPFLYEQRNKIRKICLTHIEVGISKISKSPINLFALGNVEVLLTGREKKRISAEIKNINFTEIDNVRIWKVLLFFIEDELVIKDIKSAIINSEQLWDAGFTDKGVTSRSDFIELHRLRKGGGFSGLSWSKNESEAIFAKLKNVLKNMDNFLSKRKESIANFAMILEEMLAFLMDEESQLKNQKDFQRTVALINSTLNSQREFDSLVKGLISSDKNKVVWALDEAVTKIYEYKSLERYGRYFDLLINKVLFQKEPALEASLNSLSFLVYKFRKDESMKQYSDHLLDILTQYQEFGIEGSDIPYIEEQAIRIAWILFFWDTEADIVTHYLELITKSKYNSTKLALAASLKNDRLE